MGHDIAAAAEAEHSRLKLPGRVQVGYSYGNPSSVWLIVESDGITWSNQVRSSGRLTPAGARDCVRVLADSWEDRAS